MSDKNAARPLIRLEDIYKSYVMGSNVVQVLRGVNLQINRGEFVAIMGASGSGKSTLLHIAGALDRPDPVNMKGRDEDAGVLEKRNPGKARALRVARGEVYFYPESGEEVAVSQMGLHARHHLRNRQFGFVFQFYHLLPELDVLENVLLPAMIEMPYLAALVRARPRKEEALKLLEAFGLMPRLAHRPAQLSGGERQRVAIARALINEPALLLADEPTGNLDAKTGRTILDVLVKLHRERGQTMLLVTHDPNVAALADRTVHLAEGRIRG